MRHTHRPKRRSGHTPFVQAGSEKPDTGAEAVKPDTGSFGRVTPRGWVLVSGIKKWSLVGFSAHPHSTGDLLIALHVCCCQMNRWIVWRVQMGVSIWVLQHPNRSQQAISGARRVMSTCCKVIQGVSDTWATCPTLLRGIWAQSRRHGFVVEVDLQLTCSFLVVKVEGCQCRFCSAEL